jgi:hypothetical protein
MKPSRLLLLLGVLGLALATACGSGTTTTNDPAGGGASSGTPGGTNAGGGQPSQAFTDCLQQHGVTLPSGGFPGGAPGGQGAPDGQGAPGAGNGAPPSLPAGIDQSKMGEAMQACQSLAPSGGFGGAGGGQNQQAFQAYLSCLKDHGVDVPSSTPGASAAGRVTPPSFNQSDPTFQAAQKTCSALLPANGGAGTGASTPTTAAK